MRPGGQWLQAIVAVFLACLPEAARAGEPSAPDCSRAPTMEVLAETIHEAVVSVQPDVAALDRAVSALPHAAACLAEPVDDLRWIALLHDLTLARFHLGGDWKAPLRAALWSRPDLTLRVGPSLRELRDWSPPPPDPGAVPLPYGRTLWLDGRRTQTLPRLEGLHLVQGTRCDGWESALVRDPTAGAQAADRWLARCPAPRWSGTEVGLVAAGTTTAVLGSALATVSWALARPDQPTGVPGLDPTAVDRGTRTTYRALDATGWSVGLTGAAVAVTGAVLRARRTRRLRDCP